MKITDHDLININSSSHLIQTKWWFGGEWREKGKLGEFFNLFSFIILKEVKGEQTTSLWLD